MNNKGDVSIEFTIGLILGITMLFIIGGVGIKYYQTLTVTQESFDSLIEGIEGLQEGDSEKLVYQLKEGYYLISFHNSDFNLEKASALGKSESCRDRKNIKIDLPDDKCGIVPCLCYCKTDLSGQFKEDDCIERGTCHPFMDNEIVSNFKDPECTQAVFIPGPASGVMNIYYKKEANATVHISTTSEFVPQEHQEVVKGYRELVEDIEECADDSSDCICSIDYEFLRFNYEEDYQITFYEKNIYLATEEELIDLTETEYTFDLEDNSLESNLFTLDNKEGSLFLVADTGKSVEVRYFFNKIGNTFYFYNASVSHSDIKACGTKTFTT